MCDDLMNIVLDNKDFFSKHKRGDKFCHLLKVLIDSVYKIGFVVTEIQGFAGDYDFEEQSPGNGYRSYDFLVHKALSATAEVLRKLKENRENVFFRKSFYKK